MTAPRKLYAAGCSRGRPSSACYAASLREARELLLPRYRHAGRYGVRVHVWEVTGDLPGTVTVLEDHRD